MKSKGIPTILLVFGLLLATLSVVGAGELPSPDSRPLSAILKSVEEQRLGVISEVEFDDGLWEVKICDVGACQKLYIDPMSGEEKRRGKTDSDEMPPANAMPLSTIVQSVDAGGLWVVTEVHFDDGFWEVELRKDGRKVKVTIDPRTGQTRR
jgi:hypothetical protein